MSTGCVKATFIIVGAVRKRGDFVVQSSNDVTRVISFSEVTEAMSKSCSL